MVPWVFDYNVKKEWDEKIFMYKKAQFNQIS